MDTLTFIIPAYNDEATIGLVVKKTIQTAAKLRIPCTIIVLNDASSDSTGVLLKKLSQQYVNLSVITHTKNAGYGKTMKELYKKARSPWLFSLPGDYQIEPAELLALWPRRAQWDMIIGWRRVRADSSARVRQSYIYNKILSFLFGLSTYDVNSVRLMRTSIMKSILLTSSSAFIDAELVIRAKRAGFRVTEIPIHHRARAGAGASGGKLKTILPTILDMVRFWI